MPNNLHLRHKSCPTCASRMLPVETTAEGRQFLNCDCGFCGPAHGTLIGAILGWNKVCDAHNVANGNPIERLDP